MWSGDEGKAVSYYEKRRLSSWIFIAPVISKRRENSNQMTIDEWLMTLI